MCLICECKGDFKRLEGLQTLRCNGCPLLVIIPVITELRSLYCVGCPLLTTIPVITGLQSLYCVGCPLLTTIPVITGLQTLDCGGCPLVTTIPVIAGLLSLYCGDCPLLTTIPVITGLQSLHSVGSYFLYVPIKLRYCCRTIYSIGRKFRDWAQRARLSIIRKRKIRALLKLIDPGAFVPGVIAITIAYAF